MTRTCSSHHCAFGDWFARLVWVTVTAGIFIASPSKPSFSEVSKLGGSVDESVVIEQYERFVAAQNAKDINRVREFISPDPNFQWVSDGKVFWGRETMLERMSHFQKAPVWRVEPDPKTRRFVKLTDSSAYLYQPLTLVIGSVSKPDRLLFLVNAVFTYSVEGWRIAALFTTLHKP
jgi:hypothetical protein